jgi:hypothetical protein
LSTPATSVGQRRGQHRDDLLDDGRAIAVAQSGQVRTTPPHVDDELRAHRLYDRADRGDG